MKSRVNSLIRRPASLPALFLGLVIASVAASAATVPTVLSLPAIAPIVLDGQTGEWSALNRIADEKSGIEVAFQNDGHNLYILFVARNPEAMKAIEATGLTILGRPAGSRKPAKGVHLQTRLITPDGLIFWRESQGAIMTEAEKAELRKTPRHPISVAFAIDAKGSAYGPLRRQAGSDLPDFGTSQPAEGGVYEIRVPLSPPDQVPGAIGGRPGAAIRVTLEWGGTTAANLSTRSGQGSAASQSGYMSGTGRTWGQEFLDGFDSMSRPAETTKRFVFAVDLRLADAK